MAFKRSGVRLPLAPPIDILFQLFDLNRRECAGGDNLLCRG